MRAGASGLLLLLPILPLLASCTSSPFAPFDTGRVVHCIVVAEPAPPNPLEIAPIFTVGGQSLRRPALRIGSTAVELGVLHVPLGTHRVSAFEPRTNCGGKGTAVLEGERDLWLVLTLVPGGPGALTMHDRPPDRDLGPIESLVAVPD